jgi:hypothetical protein
MKPLDPVALLRLACDRAGSQRRWALAHGVSPQSVTDVLTGHREPAGKLLEALGLERRVIYRRKAKRLPRRPRRRQSVSPKETVP